jgi:hypothetical protein
MSIGRHGGADEECMMRTKRLVAAAVAAGIAGMTFVAAASPASAWDKKMCDEWDKKHDTPHEDCVKYHTTTTKAATTTTKGESTATTVKGATTTTTVKDTTEVKAVKATPAFTG